MSIAQTDPAPPTPEGIWRILERVAKRQAKTDRRMRGQIREAHRRMKETDQRLRRLEDPFTDPWEHLVESLHRSDLAELLGERGMEVAAISAGFRSSSDLERREVDVLATTEEEAVAVAVRTTLATQDVDEFLGLLVALPSLTQYFRALRLFGAVAYLGENQGAASYAAQKGLFVIQATGNSASIVNPPAFQPRDFRLPAG